MLSKLEKIWWRTRQRFKRVEDPLLSAIDLGLSARAVFRRARHSPEYQSVFDKPNPLVSICVATYNRAILLRQRSVQSLLDQTYRNIEIIVVGDCCTDETAYVMAQINDPRLKFVNLEKRGEYPEESHLRWMVAG